MKPFEKSTEQLRAFDGDRSTARRTSDVGEPSAVPFWTLELHSFCREVAIVGMRQLVRPSSSPVRPVCWTLLMLVGAGFTIYQFQDRINNYLLYPTNVAVSVEYVEEIRFPMVTICNENRIGLKTAASHDMLDLIQSLFPPFPMPSFQPDWSLYDNAAHGDMIDWATIYGSIGQTLNETIFTCSYNSISCTPKQDFMRISTDFGNCIAFNTANSNYTSKDTGSASGLQMILFVNQDDYFISNSYSAGFRVLLQEPNEASLVTQLGFRISPGVTTQVAVNTEILSEMPPPYGTCNKTANYTQSACTMQCETNYVVSKCGCRNVGQPGNAAICSPKSYYQCWIPSMKKFITDNVASTCDCRRPCVKRTYNYVVTQSEFSEYMISYVQQNWGINLTSDQWRRNYAALEVYFSELKYTYTNSSEAYPGLALLCDVGGALGLVLGSTVLTIFEVLDLLITLLVTYRQQLEEKKKKQITGERDAPLSKAISVIEVKMYGKE